MSAAKSTGQCLKGYSVLKAMSKMRYSKASLDGSYKAVYENVIGELPG